MNTILKTIWCVAAVSIVIEFTYFAGVFDGRALLLVIWLGLLTWWVLK